jgi:hypothetical protein
MFLKSWRFVVPAGGVFILAVVPTFAQYPTPEQTGLDYSITVGAAFLTGKNVLKNTAPTVGVSWFGAVSEELGTSAAIGVTGDWILVQRLDNRNVSLVPVLLNYRQYGAIGGWRVFVNFGLGVLATTDAIPEMRLGSGATFGWSGGLGVDITSNLFFQGRFIGGQYPSDDGIAAVQLGYRF